MNREHFNSDKALATDWKEGQMMDEMEEQDDGLINGLLMDELTDGKKWTNR